MNGTIAFSREGRVATVTLEAPARRNAISVAMWTELRRVFEAIEGDDGLHCVLVRGAGGHFAAGADVTEFSEVRHDRASGRRYHLEVMAPALEAIRRAPPPVLAVIEGACVGGGLQIALACDLRVAAHDARLGAPVGRLGFPLVLSELPPLLDLVGPGVAAELLLAGRLLDAPEALAKGLVQRVVPRDDLAAETARWVDGVLSGSPLAARMNKRQLRLLQSRRPDYTEEELEASFGFLDWSDYREGVAAFLARRRPAFGGR
jgi:enoyl-CoA hydratase/carnithine racemase